MTSPGMLGVSGVYGSRVMGAMQVAFLTIHKALKRV